MVATHLWLPHSTCSPNCVASGGEPFCRFVLLPKQGTPPSCGTSTLQLGGSRRCIVDSPWLSKQLQLSPSLKLPSKLNRSQNSWMENLLFPKPFASGRCAPLGRMGTYQSSLQFLVFLICTQLQFGISLHLLRISLELLGVCTPWLCAPLCDTWHRSDLLPHPCFHFLLLLLLMLLLSGF